MIDEVLLDRVGTLLGQVLVDGNAPLAVGMTGDDKGTARELRARECFSERGHRRHGRGPDFCGPVVKINFDVDARHVAHMPTATTIEENSQSKLFKLIITHSTAR
jgi:hypothetical protein